MVGMLQRLALSALVKIKILENEGLKEKSEPRSLMD
jgi:hypothetical protein